MVQWQISWESCLFLPKPVNHPVIFLWSLTQTHTHTQTHKRSHTTCRENVPLSSFWLRASELCVMYPGTLEHNPSNQAHQDSTAGHLTVSYTITHWHTNIHTDRYVPQEPHDLTLLNVHLKYSSGLVWDALYKETLLIPQMRNKKGK